MRRRIAEMLRALAWKVDPHVYMVPVTGPILQEDVDDYYGGVVPQGRWVV